MPNKPSDDSSGQVQTIPQADRPTDRQALSTQPNSSPAESGGGMYDPHATTAFGQVVPASKQGDPMLESTVPISRPSLTPTMPVMMGRFEIRRLLGSGSFGTVFKVYDPMLKIDRAVKAPRRDLLQRGGVNLEAFYIEAQKLAQLNHPGIVKVLEVNKNEDGVPYVVSDYIAGGNLAEWLGKRKMSPIAAATLVATLADAVSYAHQTGIVHRDLKPANILMSENGENAQPIIVDFGLALSDADFGKGPQMCGTFMYMSPEQAAGEAHLVDGRADIYSLGAILYELLTNKTPYRATDQSSLRKEIVKGELRPPRQLNPEIPREIEQICLKAMAKELGQRYSTAADLAADLRKFVASQQAKPFAPPPRRSFAGWIAAAVLFAGIAGGMVWVNSNKSVPGGGGGSATTPATAAPDLEFHWQRADESGPFVKELVATDVPMRKGDKVQFHVTLAQPEYVYIYWFGHDGKPTRLWPKDPNAQSKVSSVIEPSQDDASSENLWHSLAEVGGSQAAIIGVRNEPLSAEKLQEFEKNQLSLDSETADRPTLVEFQHPKPDGLTSRQRATRSLAATPVVSPKTALRGGLPDLDRWFDAYHGYVFSTE